MPRHLPGITTLLALGLAGCFVDGPPELPDDFARCDGPAVAAEPPAAPTYYRDAKPILDLRCAGCHAAGGIAPFPLTRYEHLAGSAAEVRAAIASRHMPPWQPADCCNHYVDDRALTAAELATLLGWLDAGAPAGDPADESPSEPADLGLPRVDLRLEMPAPYTPQPTVGNDDIRCFLLDHEFTGRTFARGLEVVPGARAEVHHAIVWLVSDEAAARAAARDGADGRPGWDCHGEFAELGAVGSVGGFTPGSQAIVLPPGHGREIPAGSHVVLNVHYDTGNGAVPDQTAVELMLEPEVDTVVKATGIANPQWLVGDGMAIAAGETDAMYWFEYDPTVLIGKGKPMAIHGVNLHMHELGTVGRLAILRDDGSAECLLDIPAWDFHWMADYVLADPVVLEPGDRLYVECHFDNSAGNQKRVDGVAIEPRDLAWGTDDEMCGAIVLFSEVE